MTEREKNYNNIEVHHLDKENYELCNTIHETINKQLIKKINKR